MYILYMEFCPWKKNGSISLTLFEVISFSCEANLFFHYSFRNLVGNEVILPECEESIIRLLVFCNLDVSVDDFTLETHSRCLVDRSLSVYAYNVV